MKIIILILMTPLLSYAGEDLSELPSTQTLPLTYWYQTRDYPQSPQLYVMPPRRQREVKPEPRKSVDYYKLQKELENK